MAGSGAFTVCLAGSAPFTPARDVEKHHSAVLVHECYVQRDAVRKHTSSDIAALNNMFTPHCYGCHNCLASEQRLTQKDGSRCVLGSTTSISTRETWRTEYNDMNIFAATFTWRLVVVRSCISLLALPFLYQPPMDKTSDYGGFGGRGGLSCYYAAGCSPRNKIFPRCGDASV